MDHALPILAWVRTGGETLKDCLRQVETREMGKIVSALDHAALVAHLVFRCNEAVGASLPEGYQIQIAVGLVNRCFHMPTVVLSSSERPLTAGRIDQETGQFYAMLAGTSDGAGSHEIGGRRQCLRDACAQVVQARLAQALR